MPELPEVESLVREIAPKLTGRTLRRPRLHKTDVLRRVSPRRLLQALRGNRIAEVSRRAKHFVLRLETGERVVVQPRMTGSLVVYRAPLRPDQRRYAVLQASIGNGETMVYRDIRRLGTIELLDEAQWHAYTARIGPEPLGEDFDLRCFSARLDGTTQAIKKAIMDQRRIAGVGNIYANEALFRARIHPARRTDTLSARERGRLYRAIRSVLTAALRAHGTTIRDYRTGTGAPGSYQHQLHVYGRAGSPCSHCGARLSGTHSIDGRATTFCRRCQPRGRQARP